jgi:hypothetical protein
MKLLKKGEKIAWRSLGKKTQQEAFEVNLQYYGEEGWDTKDYQTFVLWGRNIHIINPIINLFCHQRGKHYTTQLCIT